MDSAPDNGAAALAAATASFTTLASFACRPRALQRPVAMLGIRNPSAVKAAKAAAALWWEERGRSVAERGGGHGAATMVIFNLKNMAPDDYSDKRQHEVSGGPVQIVISPDDARL